VVFGSDSINLRFDFPIITCNMTGAEHHTQPLPARAIYRLSGPPNIEPFLAKFDAQ
jgi:hypothetical protein